MDTVHWLPRLFERLSERSYFDRGYIQYIGNNEFADFYQKHFEDIDGGIYIHDLTIPFPLLLQSERKKYLVRFERCIFEDEVSFNWSGFDALDLLVCSFRKHFSARAISVKGRINVDGCSFHQGIDLTAAQLGGDLKFFQTSIDDGGVKKDSIREHVALFAAGIKAHSVILQEVTIAGRAFFGTAQLGGILKVTGNLRCPLRIHASERSSEWDHIAFDATDAKIQGQVIFGEESKIRRRQPQSKPPIEVHGQINLTNAVLGGDLICSGATLHSAFCNTGGNQSSFDSPQYAALYASRLEVEGAILLDNQFSSVGEIRQNSIRTRGLIQCRDAKLSGVIPSVDQNENVVKALSLRNSRIGSSVYLDQNSK